MWVFYRFSSFSVFRVLTPFEFHPPLLYAIASSAVEAAPENDGVPPPLNKKDGEEEGEEGRGEGMVGGRG